MGWFRRRFPIYGPSERRVRQVLFGRSLSPVYLRRKSARSVSYYALFQGWLLLGKPPGCLCTLTSFAFANSISENILSMRKPLTTRILLQARGWLVGKVSLG
ncbi:hypothetical protein V6N11_051150 [Hibiscus sabdariffa]|uniref:Uncharacterized protein n=1 Tax=Hibiscus sabdariffa TaxID=183260 RepID=A0ABR2R305_9ROSI